MTEVGRWLAPAWRGRPRSPGTPAAAATFETLGGFQHVWGHVFANLIPGLLDQGAIAVAAPAEFQIRPNLEPQTAQDLNQLIFQVQ